MLGADRLFWKASSAFDFATLEWNELPFPAALGPPLFYGGLRGLEDQLNFSEFYFLSSLRIPDEPPQHRLIGVPVPGAVNGFQQPFEDLGRPDSGSFAPNSRIACCLGWQLYLGVAPPQRTRYVFCFDSDGELACYEELAGGGVNSHDRAAWLSFSALRKASLLSRLDASGPIAAGTSSIGTPFVAVRQASGGMAVLFRVNQEADGLDPSANWKFITGDPLIQAAWLEPATMQFVQSSVANSLLCLGEPQTFAVLPPDPNGNPNQPQRRAYVSHDAVVATLRGAAVAPHLVRFGLTGVVSTNRATSSQSISNLRWDSATILDEGFRSDPTARKLRLSIDPDEDSLAGESVAAAGNVFNLAGISVDNIYVRADRLISEPNGARRESECIHFAVTVNPAMPYWKADPALTSWFQMTGNALGDNVESEDWLGAQWKYAGSPSFLGQPNVLSSSLLVALGAFMEPADLPGRGVGLDAALMMVRIQPRGGGVVMPPRIFNKWIAIPPPR